MLVTLYTDGSFRLHIGGWAFWARSEMGRIIRSGKCPEYVVDALGAEFCAVYCGIYRVIQAWPQTSTILVRSDCKGVEDPDRPTLKHEAARRLHQLTKQTLGARRVIYRWVKGHRGGSVVDAYINRQVDLLASEITGAPR